jgi:ankyrin repeat protein
MIISILLVLMEACPAYADINSDLLKAARKKDWAVVKTLIDKGADVNAKDDAGFTSLDLAKANLYVEMVELLKQYGAKEWATTHQK